MLCCMLRTIFSLLVILSMIATSSCSSIKSSTQQSENDPISVGLVLNKASFRPGEAILAAVRVTNNTSKPVQIQSLNTNSVCFMYNMQSSSEAPMQRDAVRSLKETDEPTIELAPGEYKDRTFVNTRLTKAAGPMVVQVYYTLLGGEDVPNKIYSMPVKYTVEGDLLCERDAEGVVVKDSAIKIAIAKARLEKKKAIAGDAVLVEDEAGFYRWWVNVYDSVNAAEPMAAYFINAYTAESAGEAKPFPKEMLKDPRLQPVPKKYSPREID